MFRLCTARVKCPKSPPRSIRSRNSLRFLNWNQHTQSVNRIWELLHYKARQEEPTVEHVECWVNLQHQLTF